ncbi:hypothetical protein [Lentzea sp. HUAS12]|uniref:hypothetical protein n=1 Tax=Lentzea sp. HUAS12 TaxID=2951806 RepID=UPI00209D88AF|nr:hypothetical protein [Lentzea sp. HUAS12]USX56278.1 hypothetical protein ND450_19900 [Lentzea sp. HUAS12]
MTSPSFTTLSPLLLGIPSTVGTLGPAGTSSEVAASLLGSRLAELEGTASSVSLYDTYEKAGAALRAHEVTHLVVANAYKAIHEFYMDPDFELAGVFVMDTPLYGIARRADTSPLPAAPTIASHPSPVPLIAQLMPAGCAVDGVVHVNSTSAAARAASEGAVDLALTTVPAAALHGLRFISRTRPIRMVWSVFVGSAAVGLADRVA